MPVPKSSRMVCAPFAEFTTMGKVMQLNGVAPQVNDTDEVCEPSAANCPTMAAAAPCPLLLAVKRPGATAAIWTEPVEIVPSELVTVAAADPEAVCAGIRKFTCPGDTNAIGA